MKLPQIRIESQMAKIGINTTPGKQTIEQPEAEVSIQQPKAQVTMNTTPSKLSIDQSQAWRDMGLLSAKESIEQAANRGKQAVMEGIARQAQEGDQLMKIENGGNPVVSIAKRNAYPPPKDFNIGWIPSHGAVRIQYQPSQLDIKVQVNQPIINAKRNQPVINYQPGDVSYHMKQYQDLQIDFVNLKYKSLGYETQI